MIAAHKKKRKHDPTTCFGCQLYDLMQRLYPSGMDEKNANEIMPVLIKFMANILAFSDPRDELVAMASIHNEVIECRKKIEEESEERGNATIH